MESDLHAHGPSTRCCWWSLTDARCKRVALLLLVIGVVWTMLVWLIVMRHREIRYSNLEVMDGIIQLALPKSPVQVRSDDRPVWLARPSKVWWRRRFFRGKALHRFIFIGFGIGDAGLIAILLICPELLPSLA
jgi:hypothetical protein